MFCWASQGEALSRDWQEPGRTAAKRGDVNCLRVLHECGFYLCFLVWVAAACGGHVNCMMFALSHGYAMDFESVYDSLLNILIEHGRLADVAWVLQQDLPRKPFRLGLRETCPDSVKCIEFLLAKGMAIDPYSLINAAECGDLEIVRVLHKHGIPLWQHAPEPFWFSWSWLFCSDNFHTTLVIHRCLDGERGAWKVLRYGALYGAPITDKARQLLDEKRQQTRAVLLCFNTTARLSNGPGRPEQRRVWARMAALPSPLVEEILIGADLEIQESVMHRLPVPGPSAPSVG